MAVNKFFSVNFKITSFQQLSANSTFFFYLDTVGLKIFLSTLDALYNFSYNKTILGFSKSKILKKYFQRTKIEKKKHSNGFAKIKIIIINTNKNNSIDNNKYLYSK